MIGEPFRTSPLGLSVSQFPIWRELIGLFLSLFEKVVPRTLLNPFSALVGG